MPVNALPRSNIVVPPSGTVPELADQLKVPLKVLNVAIHWPAVSSAGVPLWITPVPVKVNVEEVWADWTSE